MEINPLVAQPGTCHKPRTRDLWRRRKAGLFILPGSTIQRKPWLLYLQSHCARSRSLSFSIPRLGWIRHSQLAEQTLAWRTTDWLFLRVITMYNLTWEGVVWLRMYVHTCKNSFMCFYSKREVNAFYFVQKCNLECSITNSLVLCQVWTWLSSTVHRNKAAEQLIMPAGDMDTASVFGYGKSLSLNSSYGQLCLQLKAGLQNVLRYTQHSHEGRYLTSQCRSQILSVIH